MRGQELGWKMCVAALLLTAGCTYDSTNLGDVLCDGTEPAEAGRRCVDGVWVAQAGDMAVTPDLPIGVDMPNPPDMVNPPDMPMDLGDMPCVGETPTQLCMAAGLDCDEVTLTDRCGMERLIDCGSCVQPQGCGGGGVENKCGCPCDIGNECFNAGEVNPANDCEECQPMLRRDGWTPRAMGEACDDGVFCLSGETCNGQGQCVGATARDCSGVPHEACEVGICDEASGSCGVTFVPRNTVCALGAGAPACAVGRCDAVGGCTQVINANSCFIDGMCVATGAENPMNPCEVCVPGTRQDGWTAKGAGVSCGTTACGTKFCSAQGTCDVDQSAGCVINGQCYADGATNPLNECQRCVSATSATQWTNAPNDVTSCATDNKVCTRDVCQAGMCMHIVEGVGSSCMPQSADSCNAASCSCKADGRCGNGS
jgi:hypothetical protein